MHGLPSLSPLRRPVLWGRSRRRSWHRAAGALTMPCDDDRRFVHAGDPYERPELASAR